MISYYSYSILCKYVQLELKYILIATVKHTKMGKGLETFRLLLCVALFVVSSECLTEFGEPCPLQCEDELSFEYTLNANETECVALVGSTCSTSGDDFRNCTENAICKKNQPNDEFGICECSEGFMDEYEYEYCLGTCVKKMLDYHAPCGEPEHGEHGSDCKKYRKTNTQLECTLKGTTKEKWCECPKNSNGIDYRFFNARCLALSGTKCDNETYCFQDMNCTAGKCVCNEGFQEAEDKTCKRKDDIQYLDFNYHCPIGQGSENTICRNYTDTVSCVSLEGSPIKGKCDCRGNADIPNGYVFDDQSQICYALLNSFCSEKDKCIDPDTECQKNSQGKYICKCKTGFVDFNRKCEKINPSTTSRTTESPKQHSGSVKSIMEIAYVILLVPLVTLIT